MAIFFDYIILSFFTFSLIAALFLSFKIVKLI